MTASQHPLDRLKQTLDSAHVVYTVFAHEVAIVSAQDGVKEGIGDLSAMTPTFILDTGAGYLAAIICGDTRLSYKKVKKELQLKNVSLAAPEVVKQVTGAEVGYVSMVNPQMTTLVDANVLNQTLVYGGCGVPYHTLQISPGELLKVVNARVFDFTEKKIQNSEMAE